MQLTVGRIREAIKGLPDDSRVIVELAGLEVDENEGIPYNVEAVEVIPDHAKATLTITV